MDASSRWMLTAATVASLSLVAGLLISNFVGGETKVERRIERLYALDDPRFMHELGVLLGPPFLRGTKARALQNGDEIFPPMLAAIRAAQMSITFKTYIYWSGDIGRAFADALAERARHGVKVHVLLDWVGGAKMDDSLVAVMTQAGVAKVKRFHPPHWSHLGRLNNAAARATAGRRRPRRVHRRRWRGAAVDGPRAGPGALAQHPLRGDWPCRRTNAVGFHRQLDQGDGRRAAWPGLLS